RPRRSIPAPALRNSPASLRFLVEPSTSSGRSSLLRLRRLRPVKPAQASASLHGELADPWSDGAAAFARDDGKRRGGAAGWATSSRRGRAPEPGLLEDGLAGVRRRVLAD